MRNFIKKAIFASSKMRGMWETLHLDKEETLHLDKEEIVS